MPRHAARVVPAILLLIAAACAPDAPPAADQPAAASHLFVWTGSADSTQPDFLAVLDVQPDGDRYGRLVTTLPVPGRANRPHHTEHALAADQWLMANGFATGQTWVFDLTAPDQPRIAAQFGDREGYSHPHTFERLPNGNVLATFQMRHDSAGAGPGGLVELTPLGEPVRAASANGPDVPRGLRAYSALPIPALDRIVSTSTDMDAENSHLARELQVWRLSDLTLLHTITLPPGPRGDEADFTAEPRLLADGRTVVVSTFSCGLYLLEGLEGDAPAGRFIASFPRSEDTWCAIPVVAGPYYVVTVPSIPGVVTLDLTDASAPREVSRLVLGEGDIPHWLAMDPAGTRLVLTGYGNLAHRLLLLQFDPATGALALDERFREEGATEPGFRFEGRTWPHGAAAAGMPHGAVFGPGRR